MEGGCPFKAMLERSGQNKVPQQDDEAPGTGSQVRVPTSTKYRNKAPPNNNNNNINNNHNNNDNVDHRDSESKGRAEGGGGGGGGEGGQTQITSTTTTTSGTCLFSSSTETIPAPSRAVRNTGLVTQTTTLTQDAGQTTTTINIDPWSPTKVAGTRRVIRTNNLSISMSSPNRSHTPDSAGTSSPVSPYGTPSREHALYQRYSHNNGQVSNRPASCGTPTNTSPGKRQRKISNISTASSSAGSETEGGLDGHTERRLELRGLIEAVGTLILPTRFQTVDEINENATGQMMAIPKEDFADCFEKCKERWDKCMQSQEEYFEGD